MILKNKNILIVSPEGWGVNFVSKHHYANYLSKNNTVYFLNPVKKSKINPFGKIDLNYKKINNNLTILDYKNLLPKLNKFPLFVQKWMYKVQANQIQKKLNIKFDLVWSFDPNRFYYQRVWKSFKYIYHTVDFHYTAKKERQICQSSDFVFGVTPLVIKSISNFSSNIIKIGHGADIDGFEIDTTIKIPGQNKIKACYTGNFHTQIDYKTLFDLANENKNLDLLLIGPTIDSNLSVGQQIDKEMYSKLDGLENVYFIGSVPSNKLMSYLFYCDINLVLFKKENEITHCSPHKLMAYFYSGNITVANYIDEHKNTSSKIIIMENETTKIPKLISKIITDLDEINSEELKLLRRNFAIENSYENKIKFISKLIYSEK